MGIETEFGCMIQSQAMQTQRIKVSPEGVAARVRDYTFKNLELGIPDLHYRDWGEPPGNGGFLFNGGRLYIDMGHLEYATPECANLFDLIAYDKAIEHVITAILRETGIEAHVAFYKNNIDHYTGATFGCHENFQTRRDVPFYRIVIPTLLPFFVTRQIYAGAGRVGGYDDILEFGDGQYTVDDFLGYQISQRADHIVTEIYEWIQFSRAIINTRDEPLSDYTKYRRLHLLVGDTNMSEYAAALKIGTTALVLDAIERYYEIHGEKLPIPNLDLADPIAAIKHISRDKTFKWQVNLQNGRTISAIEIQREYLNFVQDVLTNPDEITEWILTEWDAVLNDLEADWTRLTTRLDWAAKKWFLDALVDEEQLTWDDPWLKSLDLEYHNIDPENSIFYSLQSEGCMRRVITDQQISHAISNAPRNTRARVRGYIMRNLKKTKNAVHR
jgi:proteasome accessory factor A